MSDFIVLFDVDGTLVDSSSIIVDTMRRAFGEAGLVPPMRDTILTCVGLSVARMVDALGRDLSAEQREKVLANYRLAFARALSEDRPTEVYPGVVEELTRLRDAGVLLGLATGKSARGLDRVMDDMGWHDLFAVVRHADNSPSKPHPGMIRSALSEVGLPASAAAMVGDTVFDIEMAQAAGVAAVGVGWGYQTGDVLRAMKADWVYGSMAEVVDAMLELRAERAA